MDSYPDDSGVLSKKQKEVNDTASILSQFSEMSSGAVEEITTKDGDQVDIKCAPAGSSTTILWVRVLDASGVEFLGSFSNTGMRKSTISSFFTDSKMSHNILTLKSFKSTDIGTYTCAAFKNNELIFGKVTRLVGEKSKIVTKAPPTTPHKQNQPKTTTACNCESIIHKQVEVEGLYALCSPIILGPLAGGCGLLLLLLIIISVYCNQIRTRRCPHHHKRKPRAVAPGKEMMVNRHV
ncbi:hypothetical protein PAMP_017052 [Pampus punctatissimus]